MKIYRNGIELLDLGFEPDGTEHKELMVEHSVSFGFERAYFFKLEKGDYISIDGEEYSLKEDYRPAINKSTGGYEYNLTFFNFIERTKDFKVKYTYQGVSELDFTLTTTGGQFLDIFIESLKPIGTFVKGVFPEEIKEIHFENMSIFDGMNLIAETYGTEWWFYGNVFNLSKCEIGTVVPLRYDFELDDVSFNPSSEKLVTRLYAFGSTRNLPADYGVSDMPVDTISKKRLRMPVSYVDLFPDLSDSQIVEGVKIFDEIYPRQENVIVSVDTDNTLNVPIFTIEGNNSFTINQSSIISGQALKIAFNTGNLAGREFELIIRDENKFEIKYVTEGEITVPNNVLEPQIGDKFFFFNFKASVVMPTLVDAAEFELKTEAESFLDKIGATYVYNVKTRSIYCETNLIDLGVGQLVSIYSPAIGLITSRVRGYTKQLYNKYDCEYIVGDYSKYSRLKELENLAKNEIPKDVTKSEIDAIKEALKDANTTYFAKPRIYKKGDTWILMEDITLAGVFYKKGKILQAAYATGKDSDWRLVQLEYEAKTTDGINLIRNYDLRYGLTHWGGVGEIGELTEADVIPTEFYEPTINVLGDEYGYEYAITTDDDELIIFDE